MELKDFVSGTLVQIIEGVENAKKELIESSAEINPKARTVGTGTYSRKVSTKEKELQNVEFDIALTELSGTETKGGIGVFFGAVNLGSSGQSESTNQSVNRIKFHVPITLPG